MDPAHSPETQSLHASTYPFKARKTWPPDFSKLSPKHQFRLERRYKRRAALKWARPNLMIATRLTQWGLGGSMLVYGVLFMDWGGDTEAFPAVRQKYREITGSIWTKNARAAAPTPKENVRE